MTSITESFVSLAKPLAIAGTAVVLTLAPAFAQAPDPDPSDTWSHMRAPAANGECWIPTDAAYNERGYGYWAPCPAAAAAPSIHRHVRGPVRHPHQG